MRLDVQRVDLPSVISAAIESLDPAAQLNGIKLQEVVETAKSVVEFTTSRLPTASLASRFRQLCHDRFYFGCDEGPHGRGMHVVERS